MNQAESNSKNKILVIVGMHRSGTSLTASWLKSCGLNVGFDLAGAGTGNVKGHFEDRDFYNFHEELLKYNEKDYLLDVNDTLEIADHHLAKAKSIIDYKNKINPEWGWKEPRTVVFLKDIYSKVLDNANFLVVYRHYNEVSNSLYRREAKRIKKNVVFPRGYRQLFRFYRNKERFLEVGLRAWIRYNSEILEFLSSVDPERYIVVESMELLERNKDVFSRIVSDWGFDLSYVDMSELFDVNLYTRKLADATYPANLEQQAKAIYEKLKAKSLARENNES